VGAILILLLEVGVHLHPVDVREVAQVVKNHPFHGGLGRQVGLARASQILQAGLVQARYLGRIPRRIVTHAGCFIRLELETMPRCSSPATTAHRALRSVCYGFRGACQAVAPLLSLSISGADRRRLAG
jgi:hypothetical protein